MNTLLTLFMLCSAAHAELLRSKPSKPRAHSGFVRYNPGGTATFFDGRYEYILRNEVLKSPQNQRVDGTSTRQVVIYFGDEDIIEMTARPGEGR